MSKIETLTEKLVYENAFVQVFDDNVRFPNGNTGTYYRSRWKSPYGVAVVAVSRGDVILVRNYRYAEKAWSIEIPQGFGLFGATPEEDARRELVEETGLLARKLELLMILGSEYKTYVFLGEIDEEQEPSLGQIEKSEAISDICRISVGRINLTALQEIGIFDSITYSALLAVALRSRLFP